MESKDQGFSVEWWWATGLVFLVLLIKPEQPTWRIIILASAGLAFLIATLKGKWANRTNPILTLMGESFADDDDTVSLKLKASLGVILLIAVIGFVTWPSEPIGAPGDGVVFYSPAESKLEYQPTPKGILPSKPDVQIGAETKKATGSILGGPVKRLKLAPASPTGVTAVPTPVPSAPQLSVTVK